MFSWFVCFFLSYTQLYAQYFTHETTYQEDIIDYTELCNSRLLNVQSAGDSLTFEIAFSRSYADQLSLGIRLSGDTLWVFSGVSETISKDSTWLENRTEVFSSLGAASDSYYECNIVIHELDRTPSVYFMNGTQMHCGKERYTVLPDEDWKALRKAARPLEERKEGEAGYFIESYTHSVLTKRMTYFGLLNGEVTDLWTVYFNKKKEIAAVSLTSPKSTEGHMMGVTLEMKQYSLLLEKNKTATPSNCNGI